MTDIERRALLGDKEAQAECTAKGILLPCPCCGQNGGRRHIADGNHWYYCKECQVATRICGTIKDALAAWNTRPAQPIGRCGTCKRNHLRSGKWFCEVCGIVQDLDDFCSYYEPREEPTP